MPISDKIEDDASELQGFDEDEEDEEEDDITLQDLVAMETMDDADELDMNSETSLQNSSESFENSRSSQPMDRKDISSGIASSLRAAQNFRTQHFGSQQNMQSNSPLQSYRNAITHMTGKMPIKYISQSFTSKVVSKFSFD